MIIWIGQTVVFNDEYYHVQDTDFINQSAYIGKSEHGIVWDKFWVSWGELRINM